MATSLSFLAVALVLVFLAAQAFTNALEFIGERLGVSEGVTGSVFAAVGTALPETIVPIVAILAGGAAPEINSAVGMGAILGAPFMLSTLSLGVMGLAAAGKRGWSAPLTPEPSGMRRDIYTFSGAFLLVALTAPMVEVHPQAQHLAAAVLFLLYAFYLWRTLRTSRTLVAEGHGTKSDHPLYLGRVGHENGLVATVQLLLGLVALVAGARLFVHGAEDLSQSLGVSALVISLLIVPVATELPEKVNSVIWIRRQRDTLAFGNITGAMVFQGTMIPAIGMLLMPWRFDDWEAGLSVALAFTGVLWLGFLLRCGRLTPLALGGNALLYAVFLIAVALST